MPNPQGEHRVKIKTAIQSFVEENLEKILQTPPQSLELFKDFKIFFQDPEIHLKSKDICSLIAQEIQRKTIIGEIHITDFIQKYESEIENLIQDQDQFGVFVLFKFFLTKEKKYPESAGLEIPRVFEKVNFYYQKKQQHQFSQFKNMVYE